MSRVLLPFLLFGASFCAPLVSLAVTISTVPVGNLGNAPDPLTGYGTVNYAYRIGATEVTNAQYAEFLNSTAASDPLELYNTNMDTNARGGISRSGVNGSYIYATKPNMGSKPVNYVSWYDALRFANWLHNGQGTGDTETGAYTLLGATPTPSNGDNITRNPGAIWFLPSENEWYKSAYHQPAAQGGDSDNYWIYPTRSNGNPKVAFANAVGDILNPGANVVNYKAEADWNGQDGNLTTVGSAGALSKSFYGTSDQAGNVSEWIEALIDSNRRLWRGGMWGSGGASVFHSQYRTGSAIPIWEDSEIGFRVAVIPEPSTGVMAGIGCCLLGLLRKRLKKA